MKIMKLYKVAILSVLASWVAFTACDDNQSTIGSALITDKSEVVVDSLFELPGEAVENNSIPSRSTYQLLGSLDAKEFGTFSSEIITQFMPAMQLDTTGVAADDIYAVKLMMFFSPGSLTGDSIVPMGLKVYPLKKALPSPIYSNLDPTEYYDESDCWTAESQIYTGNALYNDSINSLAYRTVSVDLPTEFGRSVYREYLSNPGVFLTPDAFAKFFKGLYIKNTFGSGRVINFSETRINFYYHRHGTVTSNGSTRDTIYDNATTYLTVSPEVISNNIINLKLSQSLGDMASRGDAILVAPAGYDVKVRFPAEEILRRYRANSGELSVINTLTLSLPVETITNDYGIKPPVNVLLTLDKEKFFADNQIPDNKTSFLATYNEESRTYDFAGMRQYILDMLAKDALVASDYTFTLTPVDVATESSSSSYYYEGQTYVTRVSPYISGPAMCKIKLADAKIKFTYSKQVVNN